MRKLLFKQLMLLMSLSVFVFSSCSDDEPAGPSGPLQPKLDGFYVYGTNTVAEGPTEPNARMAAAALDPTQGGGVATMEGIYAKYMYIGANSTLQFSEVENEVATVYGAVDGGTVTAGPDLGNTDVTDTFIHGTLEADAAPIQVSEEGLYYTYVDTNDLSFRIMRVEPQMIGDATEGMWSTGTPLPMVSASKEGAVFEGTALNLKGESGYKYRFNNGWQAFNDENVVTLNSLGVVSYGEAWDSGVNDVGFYAENIPQKETGIYTVRLEYNGATGEWTETKMRDYSTTPVGLLGNAYVQPTGEEGDWATPYGVKTPTKEGNVYTWTWDDVELIAERDFVILENGAWGGMMVFWNDATTREGNAFDSAIINTGENENFIVATSGVYDMSLSIDIETGERTLTANISE